MPEVNAGRTTSNPSLNAAAAALVVAMVGTSASAAIVNDTFDTYANQAAFEAVWTPIGTAAPLSAELSTAQSKSPAQSVRFPATTANNQSRNRLTFTETAITSATALTWSFDFYDVGTTAAPVPFRSYANLQDGSGPTGTNQLLSMGLNNNQTATASGGNYFMARILGYTPAATDPEGGAGESGTLTSGQYFKLNDTAAGLRSAAAGWRNLQVVLSSDGGAASDYKFYVDGVLAETVNNVGTALRSYDNISLGSGFSNSFSPGSQANGVESFIDNVFLDVAPVPEPASLAALAGLSVVTLRRRSRA